MLFMLALTAKYFIVGGIMYWYPTYLTEVLLMDEREAMSTFSYISIGAPTSGVICGGIFTSWLGGYNTKRSRDFLKTYIWLQFVIVIPIPLVKSSQLSLTLICIMIFLGTFVLPSIVGLMLNSIEEGLRGSTQSVASLMYNLLGFMPAPFVYGMMSFFVDNEKDPIKSAWPMATILYLGTFALPFLITAALKNLD